VSERVDFGKLHWWFGFRLAHRPGHHAAGTGPFDTYEDVTRTLERAKLAIDYEVTIAFQAASRAEADAEAERLFNARQPQPQPETDETRPIEPAQSPRQSSV
jgi:hypothetical protein